MGEDYWTSDSDDSLQASEKNIHGNDMKIASSNIPLCIKDRFEALHNDPEDSQNVSFRVKDHDFFVRL